MVLGLLPIVSPLLESSADTLAELLPFSTSYFPYILTFHGALLSLLCNMCILLRELQASLVLHTLGLFPSRAVQPHRSAAAVLHSAVIEVSPGLRG